MYKPVLVMYGLVDGLQHMLKVRDRSFFCRQQFHVSFSLQKSVKATGADVPQAVLDYIRNNDVLILEGCDKVGVFA